MRTISATISGDVGGRPRRRDFHAQNCAHPRRCHAMTVSGFTIARASDHLDQKRESKIQNARSIGTSRGRAFFRRSTASCWRSARFSATRCARGRKAPMSAPTTAARSSNTPRVCEIQPCLSAAIRTAGRRRIRCGRPCEREFHHHRTQIHSRRSLRILVVEGEPDFLTWATQAAATDFDVPLVIGVISGSWSERLAARLPTGARVIIRTHHDAAGDRYAEAIRETLSHRCAVLRTGAGHAR